MKKVNKVIRTIPPTYAYGGKITGDTIVPKKVQTPILKETSQQIRDRLKKAAREGAEEISLNAQAIKPKQTTTVDKNISWQHMTQPQKAAKVNALKLEGGVERVKQYKDSISLEATNKLNAAFEKGAALRNMTVEQYAKALKNNAKMPDAVNSNVDISGANKRGKDKGSCTTGVKNQGESLKDNMECGGSIKSKQLIPKGVFGIDDGIGLGMSAVSGVVSLVQAAKAKKEEQRMQMDVMKNNYDTANVEQNIYNDQFRKDNINDLPVYAKGGKVTTTNTSSTKGKFDTVGGALLPISEDAEVVVGNKHTENKVDGSYGVTLSKNGNPVANVEDEEVVVNNDQVFSNKLKKGDETFADIALKVNSRIGELQEVLKTSKKPSEKFSIQRTIEGLENKNNNLFKEQELVKQNTVGSTQETVEVENGVVPKGEKGLKLKNAKSDAEFNKDAIVTKNIISTLPSLADNITNAIITAKAPKPSRPIVRRSPIIDTTVNVNPALAEIKSAITAGNTTVSNNTNNSAIARANITANNLRGLQASSGVLANKDAQEIQLRNNQNKVLADTANTNSELTEDYQWDLYQNRLERNSAISKNVKNLTEDVISMQGNINTDLKDQALLNMDAKRDPTGQTARDLSKEMKSKRAAYDARIKAINARRQAKIDKLNWYNKD